MNLFEKQAYFDTIFKSRGGRLDISTFKRLKEVQHFFDHANNHLNARITNYKDDKDYIFLKELPEFYLDFIDNPNVNASAYVDDQIAMIGINVGTLLVIYDLFFRILSHPENFPGIGNAYEEEQEFEQIPNIFTSIKDLWEYKLPKNDGKKYLLNMSNNIVRTHYAHLLAQITIGFLIDHEFTHIIHGHVQYIQHSSTISLLDARIDNSIQSINFLDYQSLEFNADYNAMRLSLYDALVIPKRYKEVVDENFQFFFESQRRAVFNLIVSLYSLYRIGWYDDSKRYNYNHKTGIGFDNKHSFTHPPQSYRQLFVLEAIGYWLSGPLNQEIKSEQIGPLMQSTIATCEQIFFRLSGTENPYLINRANTLKERSYIHLVLHNYEYNILPKLEDKTIVRQSHTPFSSRKILKFLSVDQLQALPLMERITFIYGYGILKEINTAGNIGVNLFWMDSYYAEVIYDIELNEYKEVKFIAVPST